MAIDITKINGYREDMTADEKLALLTKYEIPAPDYSGYIKKETFDKTASELAEAKRLLKAKMTEDEQKEAERLAAEAAIKAELESLRKDKTVSENKAQYLALGYDEKLAEDTAKAFADGDMKKVFSNQKIFVENVKKAERATVLADGGTPPAGGGGGSLEITQEQFDSLGYSERLRIFNEQPEIYQKLIGGNENG